MTAAGHQPHGRRSHRVGPHRRHVAVLFADVTGFTRLVETVEPEIVYQMVGTLMNTLVPLVHAHGGEIQQVLGDGFMAVFGLRTAPGEAERGDEAERAVRAGLSMVGATRGDLPVHVGIEYGEVLVTPAWESAGFGVWGRAVTVAARLCDLAGPGDCQVGPVAFARSGHCVDSDVPAPVRLDGITEAVIAHRVAAGRFIGA
jgi:class 3 adenylate cyclase